MPQTPIEENSKASDINISDIISKLTQNQSQQTEPTQKSSTESPDILSSLLSNPELLAKIPQLLSIATPMLSAFLGGGQKETAASIEGTSPSPLPPTPKASPHSDTRAALLCAIKPYLCADRQAAVDYIIKLSRLGEILKTL